MSDNRFSPRRAARPSPTTRIPKPPVPTADAAQDQYLIEKLARFNRERIPERIVHAVGTGAYGYLEGGASSAATRGV